MKKRERNRLWIYLTDIIVKYLKCYFNIYIWVLVDFLCVFFKHRTHLSVKNVHVTFELRWMQNATCQIGIHINILLYFILHQLRRLSGIMDCLKYRRVTAFAIFTIFYMVRCIYRLNACVFYLSGQLQMQRHMYILFELKSLCVYFIVQHLEWYE